MPKAYGFVAYGGPWTQRFLDVPMPRPNAGQVRVAVRAAGVNPVDWKVRAGRQRGFLPLRLPAVLGREIAGVVAEVGPGTAGFEVGDEVFGTTAGGGGGYAEFALADVAELAHKPADLSLIDAAALPIAAATAYTAVRDLDLCAGRTLLVLGVGGGVGLAVLQLARMRGLRVVGTCSAAKVVALTELGACAVAYDEPGYMTRLRAAAPEGVAGVIDLVGGSALDDLGSLVAASEGVLTVRESPDGQRVRSVRRDASPAVLDQLAQLAIAGEFSTNVRRVFAFEEAAEALAAVEAGHAFGKVVIELAPWLSAADPRSPTPRCSSRAGVPPADGATHDP